MRRTSDGTASVEFVWLTILLLVPFVYVLIAVFDTQRAAFGVSTASRAAARAFLQAPDVATGERRARRHTRFVSQATRLVVLLEKQNSISCSTVVATVA